MVIRVFTSRCSGNMEIKRKQEYVMSVLKVRKIDFEEVDISDPTREADKLFMREKTPPKEGRNVPLPPQIFNSDVYCGDYESFYDAVEDNAVLELLKLSSSEPKQPEAAE